MALSEPGLAVGKKAAVSRRHDVLLLTFMSSIFTSAFLLFAVQPMFSKMVLPLLGGSPGVWSVAMVVFQALLLAGYGYAHLSTKFLSLKASALVHAGLYGVAALSLPLAVNTTLGEAPASGQEFWLAGVFLLSVGLPFFAVSANGPLLQTWFSKSSHPTASDPYYLYRASNLGSFASLILYPIAIEPLMTLNAQTQSWAVGFGVLGLMLGACAALVAVNPSIVQKGAAKEEPVAAPTARTILGWIALSFIPSAMLVAITAYLSTDVAAAPFLWVVPLAIYLASFVVVFRDPPPIRMSLLEMMLPLLALFPARGMVLPFDSLGVALSINLAFLLLVTFVCHGRLYTQRPAAQHLTSFYLWMSFGGVLGGAFCGLAAPALFNRLTEYPLLVLASLMVLPAVLNASFRQLAAQIGPWVVAALALGFVVATNRDTFTLPVLSVIFTGLVVAGILSFRVPLTAVGIAVAIVILGAFGIKEEQSERSFFGVHRIFNSDDGQYRKLAHGTTIHGSILIRNKDGAPLPARPEATTYYHPKGAMAGALRTIQNRDASPRHFAVVGLGTGAVVCNGRAQDRWTYFEIDPTVARIAADAAKFRYLSACAPDTDIVLGDARLTLAKSALRYDALIVDAFSSNAIPVHLLTREAVAMYLDRVAADGLVVLHISNRHMELESVLGAIARDLGVESRRKFHLVPAGEEAISSSHVVALSRDPKALAALDAEGWQPIKDRGTRVWTDDYSNIIGAIWRVYAR